MLFCIGMNTRQFVRYVAKVTININFPGCHQKVFTDVEFIAPFNLRSLSAGVRPYRFFPKRFVSISEIEFSILESSIPNTPSLQWNPIVMHNYASIEEMIVRNCMYALGFEYCLTHFEYV